MKKILIHSILILSTLGFGVAAKAEEALITALINDTSNPYWKTLEEGLKDTSEDLGLRTDIYSLRNASDAEGQLNQCETALLKKPKAIIFAAVDSVNLASCLRKANEKEILLVDIDGNIDEKRAKEMGITVAFSVASNNYDLGKKAADYIQGQNGKILVIEGASSSQPGNLRVNGFRENIGRNLEIVVSQSADWDRLKAADIVNRVLIQHPDLSFIFAANDTMALGAVEALRAANKSGIQVIGIDGTTDAVKAIKSGRLTASVAQLPYLMAKESLKKTSRYLAGEKSLSFYQYVPVVTLDKAVFENNDETLIQYVR